MEHYTQGISFHGEHRTNDKVFVNSVIPVIRWIDDRQEGRSRPVVLISIDTLRDARGMQYSSAMKAFRFLLETYNIYIVGKAPNYDSLYIKEVEEWTSDVVNVPAYGHLIFTNRTDLLLGDYLIDPLPDSGFMGTHVQFGSDTFKTWEEIIDFFTRLGGQ